MVRYNVEMFELFLSVIVLMKFVFLQEELLDLLLDIPNQTVDDKVYILACKILLYFAENPTVHYIMQIHTHFCNINYKY